MTEKEEMKQLVKEAFTEVLRDGDMRYLRAAFPGDPDDGWKERTLEHAADHRLLRFVRRVVEKAVDRVALALTFVALIIIVVAALFIINPIIKLGP